MSDNRDLLNDKDVCSFEEHEAENVCSNKDAVPYRSREPFAENEQHPGKNDHTGCRNGRLS